MPFIKRAGQATLHYKIDDFTDPWKNAPVIILQHGHETFWTMDQTETRFDWISWLASIPGIPADWGNQVVECPADDDPLPLAA